MSLVPVGFSGTLPLPVHCRLSLSCLPAPPLPRVPLGLACPFPLRWVSVAARGPGGKRQTSPLCGLGRGRGERIPSYLTVSSLRKEAASGLGLRPVRERASAAGRSIVLAREVGVGVADPRPRGAFPGGLHFHPQGAAVLKMSGEGENPASKPTPVQDVQGDGRWMSLVSDRARFPGLGTWAADVSIEPPLHDILLLLT